MATAAGTAADVRTARRSSPSTPPDGRVAARIPVEPWDG
ncbi:hypothetical protein MBT84_04675 [Streptomyces sp. MBT84]|nr:hypothetical protein [Streptomyces sp. MBT84]